MDQIQIIMYVCAAGGFAGIAAILTVFVNHAKYKRDSNLEVLKTQMQAMQVSFESRLNAMHMDSKSHNEAFQAQLQAMQIQTEAMRADFRVQVQAMQTGFDSQLKALTESVNSWKGLWEASTQEIRELKMEIKELRSEIDKLRTENAELKGQLKEHYKLA